MILSKRRVDPRRELIALSFIVSASLLLLSPPTVFAFSISGNKINDPSSFDDVRHSQSTKIKATVPLSDRRGFFHDSFVSLSLITIATQAPFDAVAFENRLDDKYADATPQSGSQPLDTGPRERSSRTKGSYNGLKPCGMSPNCWCSSAPFADAPARYIAPWNGKSIQDVKKVIDTYQVGQSGVDGGGFEVIDYNEKEQYLYVQFQSYKAGYIDDFECWFNPASEKFDVRSSSRVGMSDLGVNAKRLEYIGARLEKEFGWSLERRKNGSLV